MAKAKDTITDINLCQGIKLSKNIYETKENRLLTLLVKGMVVYLLTMGSIGFYLTAFSIEFNAVVCHTVILIMALVSAMLYYRLLTENGGYLIILVLFCLLVYRFRIYINSGFYAMVNITTDGAAQYFNVDIQKLYVEQIENRDVTITFAVLFIGIVLDIFLNVYISRRMQYVTAFFTVMGLNMIPLYMLFEPDDFYVIMLLSGMSLAYVYKSGRHYSPQVSVKRDDIKFKLKGKKQELAYVYDAKAMVNAGVIVLVFILVSVPLITALKPKENFNVGYKGNKYKDLSMVAVSTILTDGLSGFFRMSEDVGGLDSGKLGEVSTIRLDYQTDLVVQLAPYTSDRVYLKGFTGVTYNPYANSWTSIEKINNVEYTYNLPEAYSLRDAYQDDYEYASEAVVRVRNVESNIIYKPYFCYDYKFNKQYCEMLVYPRLNENKHYVDKKYYSQSPYTDSDLYVPRENLEAVDSIISQLEPSITQEQMIQSLINYYQENYPYTIKPGKTPYRKDFINDFLLEKKKGYCSHYASAAVLIYRRMGIPARYVEGYAIDYEQIYNGELVDGADYKDYYNGYSELGETALISVDVTDADAHAWVEVYDIKEGWHPVEVTPYDTADEEETEDFWDMFADVMDDSNADGGVQVEEIFGNREKINSVVRKIIYLICSALVLIVGIVICVRICLWIKACIVMARANLSDKLIYYYQSKCSKLRKKNKIFADKMNYRQQVEWLVEANDSADTKYINKKSQEKVISILETAGFSREIISVEEYQYALSWCKIMM